MPARKFFGFLAVAAILICGIISRPSPVHAQSSAVEALQKAQVLERLAERTPGAKTGMAPGFVLDPAWPKVLPNNWVIGDVGGIYVDSNDHVWVYHRPRALSLTDAGSAGIAGKDAKGQPVSGLGHPRTEERRSNCCTPAPSVLEFDKAGNLVQAWGGPGDPGFIESKCKAADGCYWPGREHGITVDHNGFVYISGNGEVARGTNAGEYPWAANFGGNDSQILKFTRDGKFVYAIGTQGKNGPNSNDTNGGLNGTPQPYLVADMDVDPKSNILYVADGYGNRRVLMVDAATGKYLGHFGAYGQNPVIGESTDPAYGGAWLADYRKGQLPKYFRSPLHCAKNTDDGLLYVCDRGNNRMQVFRTSEVGKPCENPNGEVGKCGFVGEVIVAGPTAGGTVGTLEFSRDPEQSCLYLGDLTNFTIYVLNRSNLQELNRVGTGGRQAGHFHWPHAMTTDSDGNIYVGEVDTAGRVQKFLRYGPVGCSGNGSTKVGEFKP